MERAGESGLGACGVVGAASVKRVRDIFNAVSEHFAVLEDGLADAEGVPNSLVALVMQGKAEIDDMVSGEETEIPDRVGQEGVADSLWSTKGRDAYWRMLNRAVAKIRGERREEFREERFKDFSDGHSGVWFQKSRESKARVLNQVPVGESAGKEGVMEAFQK